MDEETSKPVETFLVGGAVRDELLGSEVTDRDWVVVGASVQQMLDRGFKPVGKDFPVFLHPQTGEEYALARTERKTAPGYRGFEFYASREVTLEQDLERRDLTINAMARSQSGELIDPFGGHQDLEDGVLRHVSSAFSEDPVRILRVARFMARFADRGFRIAPQTRELMTAMVRNGEVGSLVAERVWQELSGALAQPTPSAFVQTLRECGALAVLLPEIARLYGVPQPEEHHPEVDTGRHVELCLDAAAMLGAPPAAVFAVLMHDLGKGLTPEAEWPRHRGHETSGVPLVRRVCDRLGTPKAYRRLAEKVTRYHLHVHRAFELKPQTILKVLEHTDAFRNPDAFSHFLLACEADARGRLGLENQPYPQGGFFEAMREAAAAVDTQSLQDKQLSGPQFGAALHELRVRAIATARVQALPAHSPEG